MESGTWVRTTTGLQAGNDHLPEGALAKVLDVEGDKVHLGVLAADWHLPVPLEHVKVLPETLVPLANLRVQFHTREDRVTNFKLNLTAEEWVDIVNKDGRWLGACCGNISSMRDIMLSALCDGGWMSASDLVDLVSLMQDHDGFDFYFKDDFKEDEDGDRDPFLHIRDIWDASKDVLASKGLNAHRAEDVTELGDAIVALSHGARMLHYFPIFNTDSDYDSASYPMLTEAERNRLRRRERHRNRKTLISTLLRVLPPLHTVYHHIKDMYPEPVSGFAICLTNTRRMVVEQKDPETGERRRESEVVIETDQWGHGIILIRDGLAISPTMEDVEQTIQLWEKETPDIRENIKVVPVTLSAEDGIVLHGPFACEDGKKAPGHMGPGCGWPGCDCLERPKATNTPPGGWWPLPKRMDQLDQLRDDGHVVVLKLDGQRKDDPDNPPYTAAIMGQEAHHADTLAEAVDKLRDNQVKSR